MPTCYFSGSAGKTKHNFCSKMFVWSKVNAVNKSESLNCHCYENDKADFEAMEEYGRIKILNTKFTACMSDVMLLSCKTFFYTIR